MNYIGKDYQKKRIKKHQKFLLKLLHLHIGDYYPLRKWLGISYKGKINQITNLSIAYNAKKLKKGYQITREYQHKDLGYKLNLVLDRIPQLSFAIPAFLQPVYGLAALAFFFLTQTTYQPSSKDTHIEKGSPNDNYGDASKIQVYDDSNYHQRSILEFDISDIPANAIFSQGDLELYYESWYANDPVGISVGAYKLTRTDWVELEATWNIYKTGSNWTSAGGDYVTTDPAGKSIVFPANPGWMTWDIQAIVENACGNSDNVEILVKFDNENVAFASRHQAFWYSNNYPTEANRPKLTVTYTVPPPPVDNTIFLGCNF